MNNERNEKKLKRGQRPEGWKNDCAKIKEYYAVRNPNWTEEQCIAAAKKFNKRNNYRSIEYWEHRYPDATHEEHLEMLNEHLTKINTIMSDRTKQVKCVEYWLSKGYTKKEAIDIISKSQATFSLEKCIEKYGLEKGTIVYNNRQNKWLKSFKNSMKNNFVNGIQSSSAANKLFSIIEKQITGQKEFILGKYAFDFVYNNKIIEFIGDFWHANPKIYDKTFINKTNGCTAKEIWKHDKDKIKYAKKHGYDVHTVWESDFRNEPETVIKKCMDFLTQ